MNSLQRALRGNPLFGRMVIFGTLSALMYVLIAVVGNDQEAHDFQSWIPIPLWIFSMPGEMILSSVVRNPGVLTWGVNAILWFIIGATLSRLTKRNWLVILLIVVLFVVVGICLYTWVAAVFRGMGGI